jgi:N-acetylglucosaminyl-diphospho-decaprenol L-rhamnosyltransferase
LFDLLTHPIVSARSSAPGETVQQHPVTISIVSHGHGDWVEPLLGQLCTLHGGHIQHVVLTHNLPSAPVESPAEGWPFRFTEVFNPEPVGFGANHNRAFGHCTTDFFCVLNPDVELRDASVWARLLERLQRPEVGCAYPLLFNPDGSRQENERELLTPLALVRRHLFKWPQKHVDWVSAAFLLVRSSAWRNLSGFDERYFMYCEDVDFCLRLQLAGWQLARADAAADHNASWASRRLGPHLVWHLRSIARLWGTPHFRRFLARGSRGVRMGSGSMPGPR